MWLFVHLTAAPTPHIWTSILHWLFQYQNAYKRSKSTLKHILPICSFFLWAVFFSFADKLSKLARIYLGKKFEPKKPTRVNLRTKCKNVTMEVEVDFMCSWQAQFPHHNSAPVDGPLKCLKSGWQRLRQGTNGVRRKVWIRKISSFVVIWAKNFFWPLVSVLDIGNVN